MRGLIVYILVSILLYIVFFMGIEGIKNKIVFHPDSYIQPDLVHSTFVDHTIKTSDGEILSAWFVRQGPIIVVYFHGAEGNVGNSASTMKRLASMGISVLAVDYRGYGGSTGSPTLSGIKLDALASYDYAKRNLRFDHIIYYGYSLGSNVACWLATVYRPKLLIMEASFSSLLDMLPSPLRPFMFFSTQEFDTSSLIETLECPLLVLHSKDDNFIPYDHSKKLFDLAKKSHSKQMLTTSGSHVRPIYSIAILSEIRTAIYKACSNEVNLDS